MLELARFYPQIRVAYTQIVTITTDSLLELNEFRQSVGAQWPFLSDIGRTIQRDLGIEEYTDARDDPIIPHTLVLGPGLTIHKVYNGYWYWGRPSVYELALDLREVSSRVRPDWRIDTPEMRAKWDAGERDAFWPYGKSMIELFTRQDTVPVPDVAHGRDLTEEEIHRRRRGERGRT